MCVFRNRPRYVEACRSHFPPSGGEEDVGDLGLPGSFGFEGGFEVLAWLAERKGFSSIPVIVFTASEDPVHVRRAYELGVRRFMRKLDDYGELTEAVKAELDDTG